MRRLHRRNVIDLELEGVVVQGARRIELPLRQVESGGYSDRAGKPARRAALECESTFAQSRGNDQRLHEVALHAVKVGRLVMLVEQARGDQEQTDLK